MEGTLYCSDTVLGVKYEDPNGVVRASNFTNDETLGSLVGERVRVYVRGKLKKEGILQNGFVPGEYIIS